MVLYYLSTNQHHICTIYLYQRFVFTHSYICFLFFSRFSSLFGYSSLAIQLFISISLSFAFNNKPDHSQCENNFFRKFDPKFMICHCDNMFVTFYYTFIEMLCLLCTGEGPFNSNAIEFHKNNRQTMQNNGWIHLIKEDQYVYATK